MEWAPACAIARHLRPRAGASTDAVGCRIRCTPTAIGIRAGCMRPQSGNASRKPGFGQGKNPTFRLRMSRKHTWVSVSAASGNARGWRGGICRVRRNLPEVPPVGAGFCAVAHGSRFFLGFISRIVPGKNPAKQGIPERKTRVFHRLSPTGTHIVFLPGRKKWYAAKNWHGICFERHRPVVPILTIHTPLLVVKEGD